MTDFGEVEVTRLEDGTVKVGRCDPVIGVSLELLRVSDQMAFSERDGVLTIAGQVRYRPMRIDGAFLVLEYLGRTGG